MNQDGNGVVNSSKCNGEPSAQEKVLRIDELREHIIGYVIYDETGNISKKNVQNMRLVDNIWFQTTNKVLRKAKKSVIQFIVHGNGSLKNVDDNEETGKLMEHLVEAFDVYSRMPYSFTPVKLIIELDFFHHTNYKILSDCFTRLGNDLVMLQVEYPKNGGTMPVTFQPFYLPVLNELSFKFSNKELDLDNVFGDNKYGLCLVQSILNSAHNLQVLVFPEADTGVNPMGFGYLQLPPTILDLRMHANLNSTELKVMTINHLPNLKQFDLQLHNVQFEDGLLFQILERVQNTLQTFHLYGQKSDGHPCPITHLRFPQMKALKEIGIYASECELGPEEISDLQICLQALKYCNLEFQTVAKLAKWTANSKFEKVEDLGVSIINEELEEDNQDFFLSPDSIIMTQLKTAFPTVCYLRLTVNIKDLTTLTYIFENMKTLKFLHITIVGNNALVDSSSDIIDSVILGLPLELVVILKGNMSLLKDKSILIKRGKRPSILGLADLRHLKLGTETVSNAESGQHSLMSEIVFGQAFMKMDYLRVLELHGKFKPNQRMEYSWKRQGGVIMYKSEDK